MKNNKLLIRILIVVVVLLIVILGVFACYNNKKVKLDDNQSEPDTFQVNYEINEITFDEMPFETYLETDDLFLKWDTELNVCVLNSKDDTVKINLDEADSCPRIISIQNDNYVLILLEDGEEVNVPKTHLITIDAQGTELSRETVPGHVIPDYNLISKGNIFYNINLSESNPLDQQKPKLFRYDLNTKTSNEYKLDLILTNDERAFVYNVFSYDDYYVAFAKVRNAAYDGVNPPVIDYFVLGKNNDVLFKDRLDKVKDIEYSLLVDDAFYIKTPTEIYLDDNGLEHTIESEFFKVSLDIVK